MIFNKQNKGTEELRELTGNYYKNNDFSKVSAQIELVTEEVTAIIGQKIYEKAEKAYTENSEDKDIQKLIRKIQHPIAIMATLRMYQRNDLSHEDDGRKFKIDGVNEKLPWQWQLDRDDELHLEDYYKALDALIRYLNENDYSEWKQERTYKLSRLLLIKNGQSFDSYFPIRKSERMYVELIPFIKEAQLLYVKKGYGFDKWEELLNDESENETEVHYAACKALALYAMSMAMTRMQIQVIPKAVIREYSKSAGAINSEPASMDDIRLLAGWMKDDADIWLNEMKKLRNGENVVLDLLPDNNPKNKYMQL